MRDLSGFRVIGHVYVPNAGDHLFLVKLLHEVGLALVEVDGAGMDGLICARGIDYSQQPAAIRKKGSIESRSNTIPAPSLIS